MKTLIPAVVLILAVSAARLPQSKKVLQGTEHLTGAELVDYVNKAQNLFKAKLSQRFVDAPDAIKRRLMDSKYTILPAKYRVNEKTHADVDDSTVPTSFDSRTNWPQCPSLLSIRDQSSCGSCWAFGAAEAMTDRICIASNGSQHVTISADDILSCCSECGFGCDGGYPPEAWNYWVESGIVTGSNYTLQEGCKPYPYAPCEHHTNATHYKECSKELSPTNQCEYKCQDSYKISYDDDKHYGNSVYSLSQNVASIQKDIMLNGPVEVSFDVYEDFEHYYSGIYQHTAGDYLGGHAVKMIGWGTENDVDFWICSNSWNSDWGEQGFFRILRGVDECGIESSVVAGMPLL